jgi:hypothetical protein
MTDLRPAFVADPPRRFSDTGVFWLHRIFPLVLFIATAGWLQEGYAEEQTIQGQIVNHAGQPLPGCIVFVASPEYRTPPAITDSSGNFQIIMPLIGTEEYFVEIYWGRRLMYRKPLRVPNPGLDQSPIHKLPAIVLGR